MANRVAGHSPSSHPYRAAEQSLSASLGQLLLAAAVAGVLVAGLLLPLVGGVGLAAKSGADSFQDLPSELVVPPLPQASRILAADGSTLATFFYENRINVSLKQVPRVMREAIVAIEDARFYDHHGVDFRGVVRAAVTNSQAGGVQQGGSTLTQQYVKNVLLESAATDSQRRAATADTLARKAREARYALALEQQWSKDKILENYLNIAYFGSGAYGVGAAAKHFFGKPVAKLTLPEAALLAGLVRSPQVYDPIRHPKTAKARRDVVLARMADLHKVTAAQATRAEATPVALHVTKPSNGCVGTPAPFFCDYVISEFKKDKGIGTTVQDRIKLLLRGGITIQTSLDPKVQKATQKAILDHTKVTDHIAAVADVVEPGTGLIKAMGVNRIYDPKKAPGHTTVNLATGGQLGVQGGSTFKIFTLTAALEEGFPLNLKLHCPPRYVSTVFSNNGAPYAPVNAEAHEGGTYDLLSATWLSVNTCFVQLEERTGVERPASIAESLGVRRVDGGALNRGGSFTLGADSISPLAMAGAYATYAAHGKFCPPTAIVSVTDGRRRSLPIAKPKCAQVLDAGIADTVTSVLRGVIERGTGTGASIPRPAAGKTGTANEYGAAWFDGYVPQLAAAVWMGDPRGALRHPLKDVTVGGTFYPRVFGGTIAAPIWGQLMRRALEHTKVEDLAGPDASVARGRQVTVPDVTGLSPYTAKARLSAAGLTGIVSGAPVPSKESAGTVASTSPSGGGTIGYGSSVLILVSNGHPPKAKPTPSASPTPTRTPGPNKKKKAKGKRPFG